MSLFKPSDFEHLEVLSISGRRNLFPEEAKRISDLAEEIYAKRRDEVEDVIYRPKEVIHTFNDYLRYCRAQTGLSTEQAAERSGVSRRAIQQIESHMIKKISFVMTVKLQRIYRFSWRQAALVQLKTSSTTLTIQELGLK